MTPGLTGGRAGARLAGHGGEPRKLVGTALSSLFFALLRRLAQGEDMIGDAGKRGAALRVAVVRLKLPGGAKVGPHTHPEEVRTLTVLSGTLYFGFGEQWDESKLTPFFSELPNIPHFVSAKDGEVIFQATGIGPSALIPVQQSPK